MTTPATDHATHDPLLIAAEFDATLDARERTRVDAWLSSCAPCIELRADLAAIAVATRTMVTPRRPRDFTLTAADADRARVGGWRRVLAAIASPRDHVTRPLAVGLTTLGIAGLLVATIPTTAMFGGAASAGAPADSAAGSQMEMSGIGADASAAGAAGADGPVLAPHVPGASFEAALPAPAASPARDSVYGGGDAGRGTDKQAHGDQLQATLPSATAPSLLVVGSLLLLATGLALALLRWRVRRLGDG